MTGEKCFEFSCGPFRCLVYNGTTHFSCKKLKKNLDFYERGRNDRLIHSIETAIKVLGERGVRKSRRVRGADVMYDKNRSFIKKTKHIYIYLKIYKVSHCTLRQRRGKS